MQGFMLVAMAFWSGVFMIILLAVILAVQNELMNRLFLYSQIENDDRPSRDAVAMTEQ
ncbi:MAG: hypothetical protein P1V97_12740 [Planctomycetota bacterium]|nr:hypothetical protein [Planctomycetota bacterium]